jgi:pilus assembly protein CpaC
VTGSSSLGSAQNTTAFGIFGNDFEILVRALRQNNLLKILAEPNLVAMNGHEASFLAGGEFPVPIPQTITGGAGTSVTVQFKEFGVRLGFKPFILDNNVIRLAVEPEVSALDFAIGTVLVPGGTPVPGLSTRRANTTVELREGQTLAIAGLLQVTLDGTSRRLPGLGDLPILGAFFSNTTSQRIEKELLVLVTPFLVEAANACQLQPTPGDEVGGPNDLEFFLYTQTESQDGRDWRAPICRYTSPAPVDALLRWHHQFIAGPHGFTD